ncbi:hypothetical protein EVAR_18651_1 [Eumeta japonica]|uniref:Uncharacterized protein n=1 Tax=Eumeta variegata TaxID=151549 RepID=A0A4C1U6X3_EUMVA|nr:hypothetical protein EVAR_18651_1 [Eumeta japonica]
MTSICVSSKASDGDVSETVCLLCKGMRFVLHKSAPFKRTLFMGDFVHAHYSGTGCSGRCAKSRHVRPIESGCKRILEGYRKLLRAVYLRVSYPTRISRQHYLVT